MTTIRVEQALRLPADDVGQIIVMLNEDQWFDRKSSRIKARELANVLIGFGNAEGGTVVVGLSKQQVEGTDASPKRRNEQIQAVHDFTVPPVRATNRLVDCVNVDGDPDHLLVFDIEPTDQVHANNKDEVFLRVGDENRKLTFAQRQELIFDKGQASFESKVVNGANVADLDETLLREYCDKAGASDPGNLLIARGLADGEFATVAGCLLFHEQPQQFFPEAYVRVVRYQGIARGSGARQQITHDQRFDGNIPSQLLNARSAIDTWQPTRRALVSGGRFGPVALVPDDAWLEGLVNAVVHRSYSLSGDHIRVEIFDDRLEITSPGRFPGLVSLSQPIDATRFARNPRIARVCADLNFGQELGEGIRRMFDEMRNAGLHDPDYRQTSANVRVVLSADPMNQQLDQQLTENARLIVGALRDGGRLSTGEVAEVLGVTPPTAARRLKDLEKSGLVIWVGKSPKDPRAYWALPPPESSQVLQNDPS